MSYMMPMASTVAGKSWKNNMHGQTVPSMHWSCTQIVITTTSVTTFLMQSKKHARGKLLCNERLLKVTSLHSGCFPHNIKHNDIPQSGKQSSVVQHHIYYIFSLRSSKYTNLTDTSTLLNIQTCCKDFLTSVFYESPEFDKIKWLFKEKIQELWENVCFLCW